MTTIEQSGSGPVGVGGPRAFSVMAKPAGPRCNLSCRYCFYLEKERGYEAGHEFRMSEAVLESYVRQYIEQQQGAGGEITFVWQGGEPTLLGVEFFERAVALEKKFCPPGRRISNAMQTNGILLDDEWCAFLAREKFLVGLSLDGPAELHDLYRVNKGGKATHAAVVAAAQRMKRHGTEFNTLTVVTREVAEHPLEVYRFLKEAGSGFMQFIPLVERTGGGAEAGGGLAEPPTLATLPVYAKVAPWSVEPLQYGRFLAAIFDEWVRKDVGRVFVQMFDVQLGLTLGRPAALCVFAETCGNGLALEHNGDLYACDHYVYPQYRRGNILEKSLGEMAGSAEQRAFGMDKAAALPRYCRQCEVLRFCRGECPKHRFLLTPDGEAGLNYLCAGYKFFFRHIQSCMEIMAKLLSQGQAAAGVMEVLAAREGRAESGGKSGKAPPSLRTAQDHGTRAGRRAGAGPGRNDLCPCGSGRKFKKCCGK